MKTALEVLSESKSVFVSKPRYYKNGDFITHFFKDNKCVASNLGPHITVFYDKEDQVLAGYQINGIKTLVNSIQHSVPSFTFNTDKIEESLKELILMAKAKVPFEQKYIADNLLQVIMESIYHKFRTTMTAKEAREVIVSFIMELGLPTMQEIFSLSPKEEAAMKVLCGFAAKGE